MLSPVEHTQVNPELFQQQDQERAKEFVELHDQVEVGGTVLEIPDTLPQLSLTDKRPPARLSRNLPVNISKRPRCSRRADLRAARQKQGY